MEIHINKNYEESAIGLFDNEINNDFNENDINTSDKFNIVAW
jgi:hypothetical protein